MMTATCRQVVQSQRSKPAGRLRLACAPGFIGEQDRRNERFWVFLACSSASGAPRSTKVGTTASPWHYDAGACCALQSSKPRRPAILRYLLAGGCRPDFAGQSSDPPTSGQGAMATRIAPERATVRREWSFRCYEPAPTPPVRPPSACLRSRCDRESCRDRVSRSERHSRSAD